MAVPNVSAIFCRKDTSMFRTLLVPFSVAFVGTFMVVWLEVRSEPNGLLNALIAGSVAGLAVWAGQAIAEIVNCCKQV